MHKYFVSAQFFVVWCICQQVLYMYVSHSNPYEILLMMVMHKIQFLPNQVDAWVGKTNAKKVRTTHGLKIVFFLIFIFKAYLNSFYEMINKFCGIQMHKRIRIWWVCCVWCERKMLPISNLCEIFFTNWPPCIQMGIRITAWMYSSVECHNENACIYFNMAN